LGIKQDITLATGKYAGKKTSRKDLQQFSDDDSNDDDNDNDDDIDESIEENIQSQKHKTESNRNNIEDKSRNHTSILKTTPSKKRIH